MMRNAVPVLTVVAALFAVWYLAAIWLNAPWAYDKATRAGVTLSASELVADTWAQDKPKLPAPHQVAAEKNTAERHIFDFSNRYLFLQIIYSSIFKCGF